MKIPRLPLILSLFACSVTAVRACDLCGCFTPQLNTLPEAEPDVLRPWTSQFFAAVAEQFTHFGTVLIDGRQAPNPTGQYEDSFITQLVAGYTINDRFALQLNVPVIYRDFKRPEGFAIDRGTESGLGDISIMLNTVAFRYSSPASRSFEFRDGKEEPVAIVREADFTASVVLLTGIKFPTGNSSRLEEEFHEIDIPGAPVSGVHGHDLTLGTGSYDGIFGGQMSLRYKNFFAAETVQFTLRGDGSHQYHFANDLTSDGGPGYYFVRNAQNVVGLQFLVSTQHKDVDRFRGKPADDTGITTIYLGPRAVVSWKRWSAEIDVDLPVSIDNTALQVVPDYRVRTGISLQF
jgi:hypothetical protein